MLKRIFSVNFFIHSFIFFASAEDAPPSAEPQTIPSSLCSPYVYQSVNVITGDYCENQMDLRQAGPASLSLRRSYSSSDEISQGWYFNHPNIGFPFYPFEGEVIEPNISYRFDERGRLIQIVSGPNGDPGRILSFSYEESDAGGLEVRVQSNDGQFADYSFIKLANNRALQPYLLEKVVTSDGKAVNYHYRDHPRERRKLLSKREERNGRYLIAEYYDSFINNVGGEIVKIPEPSRDPRIGKAKQLLAPAGCDETPVITSRFFYHQGYTEVFDALGHKTIYRYGKNKKLSAIENFLEKDRLFRIERFYWNDKDELVSKTIEDSSGVLHGCQTFDYDALGNLSRHTLYGNLTGKSGQAIQIDEKGQPIDNGVEKYATIFRYSEDFRRCLLYKSADNGISERYLYQENSDRLLCKLTYVGGAIKLRQFYEYDPFGNLILAALDDGDSEDPGSLAHVTERKITRFFPKPDFPGKGLPEKIEERHLDLATGGEELSKYTELTYSERGEIETQTIFDPSGTELHFQSFTYDDFGRLIAKTDRKGNQKSISYDENGNQVRIAEEGQEVINTYDFCNRLIRSEQRKKEGPLTVATYKYDFAGNRIAMADLFGNETTFEYDALGRLIKTISPPVPDGKCKLARPTKCQTYDILDRVVSVINENGNKTLMTYNARGKPVKVVHADGREERFEYNLDGTLKKATQKNGHYIVYDRDFLGRAVLEEKFTEEGKLIGSQTREYSAFHLLKESDLFGNTTLYHYDGAGREKKIIHISPCRTKETEIAYDPIGRPIFRKDSFGPAQQECVIALAELDEDRQIVAFAIQDSKGEVLKRKELKASGEKPPQKDPVAYCYNYYNAFGQNVLKTESAEEGGLITITVFDALQRPVQIEKKNICQQTVFLKEICYDPIGNKIKEIYPIIGGPEGKNPYVCKWSYDTENRVESSTEGYASGDLRTSFYSYNADGKIERVTKPDGVSLVYDYSPEGLLLRLSSSDGSVDYEFFYNAKNQLIKTEDRVHCLTACRELDDDGNLSQEILGNGLSIGFAYDASSRKTDIVLPDGSKIHYTYDAAYLRSVERISPEGEFLYRHDYKTYSLSGKTVEETLIGGLGGLKRSYDRDGHLIAIETPYWSQFLERDGKGRVATVKTEDPGGDFQISYAYDPLGQLIEESGEDVRRFSYDSLYNRTEAEGEIAHTDDLGQLTKQGSRSFSYDLNGNLIKISGPEESRYFAYDALNRLVHAEKEGEYAIDYQYDAFNRRILKIEREWDSGMSSWSSPVIERYLYDGMNEIGEVNEIGEIEGLKVLGIGLGGETGAACAIELKGEVFAPIQDHRGSICCLVSMESGLAMEWSRYVAFGEKELGTLIGIKTGCPWGFSGKRTDEKTGFVYFGARYYDPATGRWITKDPLGTPETINRFAYNLNDPVNRIDAYGLFSFTDIWSSFWETFDTIFGFASRMLNTLISHVSCSDLLRPAVENIAQAIFGKSFLLLSGFYEDISETGTHGKGEISDKVRVTLINGILNARSDYKQTLDLISDAHGGANIHYIFDATSGWGWDILKSFFVKCGYISPQAQMIADTWRKMIQEMGGAGGGGTIYHYAHSIGAAHTSAALSLMTPEEKKMIKVFTFGTPLIIEDEGLNSVCNYVSVRDGVCLFDPVGYFSGILGLNDKVVPVGDWLGIPMIDHTLNSGTYMEIIKMLGEQFLYLYVTGQNL